MKLLGRCLIGSITLFLIFVPCSLLAEDDSIWLAGMNIKIGMAKSVVLSEIGKNNRIHAPKEGQADMWTVVDESGGIDEFIGTVEFKNDRAIRVNRSWGSFRDKQAKEFVKAFYNLLSNLGTEGKKVALCRTESFKQPGVVFETINLFFGQKIVNIIIAEDKHGFSININETLR